MNIDGLMLSFTILLAIFMFFCTSILINENQKILDNQNKIYSLIKDK